MWLLGEGHSDLGEPAARCRRQGVQRRCGGSTAHPGREASGEGAREVDVGARGLGPLGRLGGAPGPLPRRR